jgi:lysozyme
VDVPSAFFIGVVDLSHHQKQTVDWQAYIAGGGVAVIHKATESLHFPDPLFAKRKKGAKAAGLLWGSYHYAGDVGADGKLQADHFLSVAEPEDNELMAFDCEKHGTLKQMEDFVARIQQVTGRLPVIYGRNLLRALMNNVTGSIVTQCALWFDDYPPEGDMPRPPLPHGWTACTLWQYTDGKNGPTPHDAPGIGHCDRNAFNGTADQLKAAWPFSLPVATSLKIAV